MVGATWATRSSWERSEELEDRVEPVIATAVSRVRHYVANVAPR